MSLYYYLVCNRHDSAEHFPVFSYDEPVDMTGVSGLASRYSSLFDLLFTAQCTLPMEQ
jgi:hypothetical protein